MRLDQSKFWVPWTDLHNGVLQYTCYAYEVPWPVGMAMVYRTGGDKKVTTAQLLWIYTLPFARRQGVARALLKEISSDVGYIVTQSGSEDGGLALITSFGFVLDAARGDFFWTKPPPVSK